MIGHCHDEGGEFGTTVTATTQEESLGGRPLSQRRRRTWESAPRCNSPAPLPIPVARRPSRLRRVLEQCHRLIEEHPHRRGDLFAMRHAELPLQGNVEGPRNKRGEMTDIGARS